MKGALYFTFTSRSSFFSGFGFFANVLRAQSPAAEGPVRGLWTRKRVVFVRALCGLSLFFGRFQQGKEFDRQ